MKSILLGLVVLAACGGGSGGGGPSGIPDDTLIADLDADETTTLCEHFVDLLGPERVVDCGDGQTVTFGSGSEDLGECIDDFSTIGNSCPLTVDDFEACISALGGMSDAEICAMALPVACEVLDQPDC